MTDDEAFDLGACCACGDCGPQVRNILALQRRAPTPGTGWGCFRCGLPPDGAIAVVCDACLAAKAEIRWVTDGLVCDKKRSLYELLSDEIFEHRRQLHPELLARRHDHGQKYRQPGRYVHFSHRR